MKAIIKIPSYIIQILKECNPKINDRQLREVFQTYIQDQLIQDELCTGMPNNFETWLENDDTKDILEGIGL